MPQDVKVNTTIKVADKTLMYILTTAVEGGCNYWADLENVERDEELNVLSVEFRDNENGEYCGKVGLSAVAVGMERILNPFFKISENIRKDVLMLVIDPDSSNWDAETADCIIQAALFDELVYG